MLLTILITLRAFIKKIIGSGISSVTTRVVSVILNLEERISLVEVNISIRFILVGSCRINFNFLVVVNLGIVIRASVSPYSVLILWTF